MNYIVSAIWVYILFCTCIMGRDITVNGVDYKDAEMVKLNQEGLFIKHSKGILKTNVIDLDAKDRNMFLLADVQLKNGKQHKECLLFMMSKSFIVLYKPFERKPKDKKVILNKKELSNEWQRKLGYRG